MPVVSWPGFWYLCLLKALSIFGSRNRPGFPDGGLGQVVANGPDVGLAHVGGHGFDLGPRSPQSPPERLQGLDSLAIADKNHGPGNKVEDHSEVIMPLPMAISSMAICRSFPVWVGQSGVAVRSPESP